MKRINTGTVIDIALFAATVALALTLVMRYGWVALFHILLGAGLTLIGFLIGWMAGWDNAWRGATKFVTTSADAWRAIGRSDEQLARIDALLHGPEFDHAPPSTASASGPNEAPTHPTPERIERATTPPSPPPPLGKGW